MIVINSLFYNHKFYASHFCLLLLPPEESQSNEGKTLNVFFQICQYDTIFHFSVFFSSLMYFDNIFTKRSIFLVPVFYEFGTYSSWSSRNWYPQALTVISQENKNHRPLLAYFFNADFDNSHINIQRLKQLSRVIVIKPVPNLHLRVIFVIMNKQKNYTFV